MSSDEGGGAELNEKGKSVENSVLRAAVTRGIEPSYKAKSSHNFKGLKGATYVCTLRATKDIAIPTASP